MTLTAEINIITNEIILNSTTQFRVTSIDPFTRYPEEMKILFAVALGMLLGVEREWSQKPAGLRTFVIITVIATVFVIVDESALLILGLLLVIVQGTIFAIQGLISDKNSFLLTTSVSMVLAYGIGVLIGHGFYHLSVIIAITISMMLVLKRDLHGFARNLSKNEIQSGLEFSIIAFIIFPVLPNTSFGPNSAINPRTVWLLIVAISAIGFINYLVVQKYGTKGIAITSFFGGLVNSTAVIGEIVSRTRQQPNLRNLSIGAILLANAAMASRDLLIIAVFSPILIVNVGVPLIAIIITAFILSYIMSDWNADFEMKFSSPFNLKTAMKFGVLFLIVLVISSISQDIIGTTGFIVSSFLSGMVSSGAVTTSVVLLVESGQMSTYTATTGIIGAVFGSIVVKVGLAVSMDRSLTRPISLVTVVLLIVGTTSTVIYYI